MRTPTESGMRSGGWGMGGNVWAGWCRRAGIWGLVGAVNAVGVANARGEDAGGAAAPESVTWESVAALWSGAVATGERWLLPLTEWMKSVSALERVAWGGLVACGILAFVTLAGRLVVVRRGRVIPQGYQERFHSRLLEARIDWAQGIDYCELNPSAASRVALAAIRLWGRPVLDLERGVARARKVEVTALRSQLGTLRRIAALAPLVGLLGSLAAASRLLPGAGEGVALGSLIAASLSPLTLSVGLAILALVAYDGLTARVESLACELDRLGTETVEAVALAGREPPRSGAAHRGEAAGSKRAPHAGMTSLSGAGIGRGATGGDV